MGVPYGTSYWQVGDSSEQNGCFKMALTRYKRELLRRKELAGVEFGINKEDILTLLIRHGLIPLHVLYTTNQPSQIVDGIHSTTIVCFTLKLRRQGMQENVAAMPMMTEKMSWYLQKGPRCMWCNYSICQKGCLEP